MLNIFLRVALFCLGAWLTYMFGSMLTKTILYRMNETTVEGRVIGFTRLKGTSVLAEGVNTKGGKRRAHLPVFRYAGPTGDSLTRKSPVAVFFSFTQFDLNERVKVVYAAQRPEDAYIFDFQLIVVGFVLLLFSLFMMSLGWRRSL
jgi:hypothetical protein